jgi:hypothetical protein
MLVLHGIMFNCKRMSTTVVKEELEARVEKEDVFFIRQGSGLHGFRSG